MAQKVAVLYGGLSTEREVSLRTGNAMYKAIKEKGYEVELIDVDRNVAKKIIEYNPDVAVIGLHGKYGEDGCIQGLLEILNIPYTGPGVMASSIAMNKVITKKILTYEGIPTPKYTEVNRQAGDDQTLAQKIMAQLPLPLVLKAPNQGSSIGINFAFNQEELVKGIGECFKYDDVLLAETYIKGRELTVSVIGNEEPIALPALEIVSNSGVYDYHAKYTSGASRHFVVKLPENVEKDIKDLAIKTYKAIGCSGLSRVDFLLDENDSLWVLEINTCPGMTETSLFPDAAMAAGINFPDLMHKLINYALEKHSAKIK